MAGHERIQLEAMILGSRGQGVWDAVLANGHRLLAHLETPRRGASKKIQDFSKDFLPGCKVLLSLSTHDFSRGCVLHRSEASMESRIEPDGSLVDKEPEGAKTGSSSPRDKSPGDKIFSTNNILNP